MSTERRITTPMRQRLRWWIRRPVPVLVWVAAVGVAVVLARRSAVRVDAVGVVEVRQAVVAPIVAGKVRSVRVDLFDAVRAGEVVGAMDESEAVLALEVIKAEAARLRALVAAQKSRLENAGAVLRSEQHAELRRFVWNAESAELDLLDRRVAQEFDRVEVERLAAVKDRLSRLTEGGAVSGIDLDEARLAHEALRKRIDANVAVIKEAEARLEAARSRLESFRSETPVPDADLDLELEPLRQAVLVQKARLESVAAQRRTLVLRAPIDGVVSQVFVRAGESVLAGAPVVAITDPTTRRIVAHIPEGSGRSDVRPGDPVDIVRRTTPAQITAARILKVGPAREEIPVQARRMADRIEWGFPVLIVGSNLVLQPGETVDVRIPVVER